MRLPFFLNIYINIKAKMPVLNTANTLENVRHHYVLNSFHVFLVVLISFVVEWKLCRFHDAKRLSKVYEQWKL